MHLQSIISIVGASQGFFLSLMFLVRRRHHPALVLLAVYIFLFSIGILENFHNRNTASSLEKVTFSFIANANLLYGPLIFLFIRHLEKRLPQWKNIVLHSTPFMIFYFVNLLFITQTIVLTDDTEQVVDIIAFEILVIQLTAYSLISLHAYKRMRKKLLNTYTGINIGDLNWILYLLYLVTITYLLSFAFSHLLLTGILKSTSVFVIIQVLIALFTYLLGYRMFVRPVFFLLELPGNNNGFAPVSYRKSGLKKDQAENVLDELARLMQEEKLFRNEELTVYDVAGKLNISRNHLTEALNVYGKKSFLEFVNSCRVEEAKRMLLDPGCCLSITGIGKEAGFKSANSFYSNFKKMTGTTPAHWRSKGVYGEGADT